MSSNRGMGTALASPLATFEESLAGKDPKTIIVYRGVLRGFARWLSTMPGGDPFSVELVTQTAVQGHVDRLAQPGRAPRARSKALSALRRFCRWVQDEGLLRRNPAAYVERPTVTQLAPRELSDKQRYVLKNLVERRDSKYVAAIFALGYWAGLRVSEVATLRLDNCDLNRRVGALTIVDSKQGKTRTIDLHNEARRRLYEYIYDNKHAEDRRDPESEYVFSGQRAAALRQQGRPDHLTIRGAEHVPNRLKRRATVAEWVLIGDVRFHDLRHDFAHRGRAAGWGLEQIAAYLGHQTRDGAPAINTTVRYALPGRERPRERVKPLPG
ncbi:MAG: tyrosine-type recombinase/integrase [Candidatus Schekmanbacteria bacterium]|nr:tyrosine-type recombinase/integrase [Candidatus Schekmanbacteria bacterium]